MTIDPTKRQDEPDQPPRTTDDQSPVVDDLKAKTPEQDEQVKGGKIRSFEY